MDREATFRFYRRLGELMNIGGMPETATAFEAEFDRFERERMRFSPAVRALLWLAARTRRRGKDAWYPGRPNPAYPGGYTLDQIGPAPVRQ